MKPPHARGVLTSADTNTPAQKVFNLPTSLTRDLHCFIN